MFFDAPGGKIGGPTVFSLDLDFHLGPKEGAKNDVEEIGQLHRELPRRAVSTMSKAACGRDHWRALSFILLSTVEEPRIRRAWSRTSERDVANTPAPRSST